ncbi:MAG: MFS transporter [Armatimonadota bacterium]|nr:MFS transporter [Armatimonadota bacterium]
MFSALRNRDYRLYWGGTVISWIGSHIQFAAQGWYVYQLTGGSFEVGVVGFFGQLPMLLTLLGGVVADRINKRKLLIVVQTIFMLNAFLLGFLVAKGLAGVWTIAVFAFCAGIAGSFETPARHALPIHLVGKADLMNAIALNSAAFNVARILGPALAGLLLAHIGVAWCFIFNGVSYIAVIAALFMIRSDTSPALDGSNPIWEDLIAGIRYVYKHPVLRTLVLMGGVQSLFVMQYLTLLPELASEVLKVKATGYGALTSCVGVGALLGALRLAGDKRGNGRGKALLIAGAINSIALIMLSISKIYALSAFLFLMVGIASVTYNQTINTLVQTISDHKFRARAVSAFIFVFLGMAPVGNLLAGSLAKSFGVTVPLVAGGVGVAAIMTLVALTQPEVRNL